MVNRCTFLVGVAAALQVTPLLGQGAGSALRFDGGDDYVSIAHSDSLNLARTYSIELFFKPESPFDAGAVLSQGLFDKGPFRAFLDASDGVLGFQHLGEGAYSAQFGANLNGRVQAMAVYNGKLFAAGEFSTVAGKLSRGIAKWNGNGWAEVGGGIEGEVTALAVYNGELYAGGIFTLAGGVKANNIARWNGLSWQTVGGGVSGGVRCLRVYGAELFVGGGFGNAGGMPVARIARWNGTTWSNVGTGLNGSAHAMAEHNGALFVGGTFTTAGGVPASRLARWDGAAWSDVGADMNDRVAALAVYENELYAGGDFTSAGGAEALRMARWDGGQWRDVNGGVSDAVRALCVYDGDLYLGGNFLVAGEVSVTRIAKWDGVDYASISTEANFTVESLATYDDELIAGGTFTIIGGVRVNGIARWNGNIWRALHTGLDNAGWCLQVFNNELYAGGEVTMAGGVPARSVAKWTGAGWVGLDTGMNDRARAFAVYQDSLIVGGEFTIAGGQTVDHITRWDGQDWHPLGTGLNGTVLALTVYDGMLIAGGGFTGFGESVALYLAAWDSQSWHDVGSQLDGPVAALLPVDGVLYIGGDFTRAGTMDAPGIVRWDGREFSAVGEGFDAGVEALAFYKGNLHAAGHFTEADGAPANHIARWDGNAWQPLGAGLNNIVRGLGVFNDALYAGGVFTATGDGMTANAIARWNGLQWNPVGSGADDTVRAFAELDGALFLTGRFTTVADVTSPHIALWEQPVHKISSARTTWPSEPHHIAITNNGNLLRMYVNGTLDASITMQSQNGDNAKSPLWIGRTNGPATAGDAGEFFAGEMDEVRFWLLHRSIPAIRDDLNRKLTGAEPGLAGYWRFDEGAGASVSDSSPNGHAGTIFGPAWTTSTAPLGDEAVWTADASSLTLASSYGDSFSVTAFAGNPPFASLMRIDNAPNSTDVGAGLFGVFTTHYFETWMPGDPQTLADVAYAYEGHPDIVDENVLALATRPDAAATQWSDTSASLDTVENVLLIDKALPGQFVLGEAGFALEMAVDPPDAGATVPPAGTITRYRAGDIVELLAAPAPDYVFDQWQTSAGQPVTPDPQCATSATVVMDADKTVTARFENGGLIDSTWIGGTTCLADPLRDCWSAEDNWCPAIVPNNGPGRTFDVFLDASMVVTLDLSPSIDALTLVGGTSLEVDNASGASVRTLATVNSIFNAGVLRATDRKRLVLDAPVIDQLGICADCNDCTDVGSIEATDGQNMGAEAQDGDPKSIVEINGSVVIGGRARTVGENSEIHLIGGAELDDVCVRGVIVPDGQTGRFRSTLINDYELTIGGDLLTTQFEPAADGSVLEGAGSVQLTSQTLSRLGNFKISFVNAAAHTIKGAGIVFGGVSNFGVVIADEPGADLILFPPGIKTNHGGLGARRGGTLRVADDVFGAGQVVGLGGVVRLVPGVTVNCAEVYLSHDPDGAFQSAVRVEGLAELRVSCIVSLGWNQAAELGGCAPPPPPTQPVGPPPLLFVESAGLLDVDGRMELLRDDLAVEVQAGASVRLAGDFVNQSRSPDLFVWQEGSLTLDGADQQYESAGQDRGADASGFDQNFALHTLALESLTTARIIDAFDNQNDGQAACDEALYVDTLALNRGATLITEGCRVYYRNLINNGGDIPGLGDDVLNIPNADYDGDGDVDVADYAAFHDCMTVMLTQTCRDRFDADHNQSLDLVDYAYFQSAHSIP